MQDYQQSIKHRLKRGISKVLVATVLVTSIAGGYQPGVFAAPSTKTQTEKNYEVTFEEKDVTLQQSDWQFSTISQTPQIQSTNETVTKEMFVDGKWQPMTQAQITWSDTTQTLAQEAAFTSGGVGKNWPVQVGTKVDALLPSTQQNQAKPKVAEATAQAPQTSNFTNAPLKATAIQADYSLGQRIQTPTMRAAGVQAYTANAPTPSDWKEISRGARYQNEADGKWYQMVTYSYPSTTRYDEVTTMPPSGTPFTTTVKETWNGNYDQVADGTESYNVIENQPVRVEKTFSKVVTTPGYWVEEKTRVIKADTKPVSYLITAAVTHVEITKVPAKYGRREVKAGYYRNEEVKYVVKGQTYYDTKKVWVPAKYEDYEISPYKEIKIVVTDKAAVYGTRMVPVGPDTIQVIEKRHYVNEVNKTVTWTDMVEEMQPVSVTKTRTKYKDVKQMVTKTYYSYTISGDKTKTLAIEVDGSGSVTPIPVRTPTTYWTTDGASHIGYVENDRSYQSNNQRLDNGMIVAAGGKYYEMVNGSGVAVQNFDPTVYTNSKGLYKTKAAQDAAGNTGGNTGGNTAEKKYPLPSNYIKLKTDSSLRDGTPLVLENTSGYQVDATAKLIDGNWYIIPNNPNVDITLSIFKVYTIAAFNEPYALKSAESYKVGSEFQSGLVAGFTDDVRSLFDLAFAAGDFTEQIKAVLNDAAVQNELFSLLNTTIQDGVKAMLAELLKGTLTETLMLMMAKAGFDIAKGILEGLFKSVASHSLAYNAGYLVGLASFELIGAFLTAGIMNIAGVAIKGMIAAGVSTVAGLTKGLITFLKSNAFKASLSSLKSNRHMGAISLEMLIGKSAKEIAEHKANATIADGVAASAEALSVNDKAIKDAVKEIAEGTSNLVDDALAKLYKDIPLGRGNTGRTIPNTLQEQLAMKEVLTDPLSNATDLSKYITMTDDRWLASEGWIKMSKNVNDIEIHYVYNKITGAFDDFKFK